MRICTETGQDKTDEEVITRSGDAGGSVRGEIVPDSGDNTLNITLGATFAIAVIFLLGTNVGKVLDEEASLKPLFLTGGSANS